MLRDPERSYEWTQEVRAPNLEVARVRCQNIANSYPLTDVQQVTQRTVTPNKQGECKFICWFISEGEQPNASDRDS